ncbi:MAG: hypothetical protein A2W22_06350 [Candidatus Levybacteria bacterium RBG_16_35_11]|nr:MAG: hypothetical protein A2W22_06350 [Candidatus Levybacteria bacterium RBG_16_35_11]
MGFIKRNLFLIIIILVASILRFFWLDKIPNAIGGDELVYVLTAKSIFLRWSDLTGVWNPFSIFAFQYPPGEAQAELPYFLLTPFVGFANFSLLTSRVLYAILSILSVLVIYLISDKLFSKKVAIFAGFIAAINPWFIYIGRTNYEVVPAVFFFLLSFYSLLLFKGWKILISIPFLFFAFYSYIGTKLIFLPFVFIAILYSFIFINKRKYLKQYLIVFFLSLILVLFFAFSVKTSSVGERSAEIFLPTDPYVSNQVDLLKHASIQTPFIVFFQNKANLYVKLIFTKLIDSFSFNYLFLRGDSFFNINYGFFYIIDVVFLILGLVFAFSKKKKAFILLTIFILLGALPQVFYSPPLGNALENFAPHLALIFPFLIIFIGVGLAGFFELLRGRKIFYYVLGFISFIYFFSVLGFFYLYFFQFPLQGNFDFHVRLMSKYVKLASKDNELIIIYSPKFKDEFKKYLFYSNSLNGQTIDQIATLINSEDRIKLNNIEFWGCNNTIDPSKTDKVIVYDYICGSLPKEKKHLTIPRLLDGGESYRIYNDQLCLGIKLRGFPRTSVSDFSIEEMSTKKFCETFITLYK